MKFIVSRDFFSQQITVQFITTQIALAHQWVSALPKLNGIYFLFVVLIKPLDTCFVFKFGGMVVQYDCYNDFGPIHA